VAELQVGDAARLTLRVRAEDTGALTAADALPTCVATPPGGTGVSATVVVITTGVYRVRHPLTVPGVWHFLWSWAVGGTGDVSEQTVNAVSTTDPDLDPQPWTPTLREVGALIPTRTREVGVLDTYVGTFTALTTPTDEQVLYLIEVAVGRTIACTGLPVAPLAHRAANGAAALRAAYLAELSYPERDADVAVYEQLGTQADQACKEAGALNRGAGGGGSTTPDPDTTPTLLPASSFPAKAAWADSIGPTL
jgi:hypothetical protein